MDNIKANRRPGLYVHIPFCKTKCPYCNFYSTTDLDLIDTYIQALTGEMRLYGQQFPFFDTLYIGGGTPSVLDKNGFEKLFRHLRDVFSFDGESEVTVEINPADCEPGMFSFLRQLGVNRLNIGVQSFDDRILSFLGRRHNVREARTALDSACRAGFAHLGADLIYGVPGQSKESWRADLRHATAFPVDHLSCYQLSLERDTPLGVRFQNDEFDLPDEKEQLDFFLNTSDFLTHSGYCHYEISNFAKGPDARARHNGKYWDHTPYLGLGPAAHSFDGKRRWWNRRSLTLYLGDLDQGLCPVEEEEILTIDQLRLETLFLGFRTAAGIDITAFNRTFKMDLLAEKARVLGHLEQEGLIVIQEGFLRPTLRGMAVADQLALI